jgi:hypothetical protein
MALQGAVERRRAALMGILRLLRPAQWAIAEDVL